MVSQGTRVVGERGEGVQPRTSMHSESNIQFTRQGLYEGICNLAGCLPGRFTGCGGIEPKDQARALSK